MVNRYGLICDLTGLNQRDGEENMQDKKSYSNRLLEVLRRLPGVRGLRTRVLAETRAVYHAVRSGLWREMLRRRRGRGERRKQLPLAWDCNLPLEAGPNDLGSELGRLGIQYREGAHAIYVPPQPRLADKLGAFVASYPEDAGYKILKNPKGPADA